MKSFAHLQMHMCTSMNLKVELLECQSCTSIFLDNAKIFQNDLLKCSFFFFIFKVLLASNKTMETVRDFISWAPKSLNMVTAAVKLEDICSLEVKLLPT